MSRRNNRKKNTELLVIENKKAKFNYTIRLEAVLLDISDDISFAIMGSHLLENEFGYKLLDLSDKPNVFKIHLENKGTSIINIQAFIDKFFNKKFHVRDIEQFVYEYNKRIPKTDNTDYYSIDVTPYEQEKFEYRPKDVFYTFNSLCYKTYPHGTEDRILKYIPIPLLEDNYGNYYIKIGESDTMFTSHFDSACRQHEKVRLLKFEQNGDEFAISDGKTILSADDKAGVTVMLYMIEHNVPGLYYFFLGEERGGIGSGLLSSDYHLYDYLKGINKCVSFDRRNYHSVITHQGGTRCCSDDFGTSLCEEFNNNGLSMKLDNTGLFTDSANFTEHIPECTNISVGYFSEHSVDEYQNITFLKALCEACINVKWDKLTVKKSAGINKEILERNNSLLVELRQLNLYCESKLKAHEDRVFLELRMNPSTFHENYEDLKSINTLLSKYHDTSHVFFEEEFNDTLLNIELK